VKPNPHNERYLKTKREKLGHLLSPSPALEKISSADSAGEAARRFQVLFVDDSLAFLETFGTLCGELGINTWDIHTATTADRALAIMQQRAIDLVVLDIGMPTLDGIQLLGIIARRYADVKIAVLTGLVNEANRAACLAKGAELFLEKPVSAESIKVAFNMLNDLLLWSQREGFSGSLRQVGLTDVIQMECLGRHSLVLEVRNRQTSGQIFIEGGKIIHATMGNLSGIKAFQQLLALPGGEFQFKSFRPPPEFTVEGSWEFLLMEASRVRDENMLQKVHAKKISARGGNFAIVASKYNSRFVDAMLRAAKKEILRAGGKIEIVRVPGAYEIPVVAAKLARAQKFSAILCLGVILRGATTHAQHIGEAVSNALVQIQIQHEVPVIHEVLLLENVRQAEERCLSRTHNRGTEAAQTALEMARLMTTL
jgi:6,7-dimethyl-8-ribityllumazine synthase